MADVARQILDESLMLLLPSSRRRGELLDATGELAQRGGRGSRADRLTVPFARLDALAAAGMVSAEEAEQWRSRYERALDLCERPLPGAPAQLAERARRWLDDYDREARAEVERAAPQELEASSRSRARMLQERAQRARYCFAELGLLPDGEAYLEQTPTPGPRRTELQAVAVTPDLEPDQAVAGSEPRCTQLRGVAAADDRSARGARLTCAELYADAVVLRWILHLPREPSEGERRAHNQDLGWLLEQGKRHAPTLRLTDDQDTDYHAEPRVRGIGGPSGPTLAPGPLVVWGATTFVPSVPEGVASLDVHIDDRRVLIPLTPK